MIRRVQVTGDNIKSWVKYDTKLTENLYMTRIYVYQRDGKVVVVTVFHD